MKERNTLLQQPIVYFALLLGNNAVACFTQIEALKKSGEAFDDENHRYGKRDLQHNVESAFQIDAVDDVAHDPGAERCR
ncbi:hypothetical protein D3C86_1767490 [compost metagenome]